MIKIVHFTIDDKNCISADRKVLSVEFEITDCIFSWPVSRDRFPQSFWQDQTHREGGRGREGREGGAQPVKN